MKKIKSKLIYVNPSIKPLQKPSKSPSPDSKNKSKIQKTNSPVKQVEHYYKIKTNTIGYYCTQDQKHKKTHQQNINNLKKVSSFSLNDSNQQIDLNNISQTIKLKSPSSLYHSSTNQHSSNIKCFPLTNNQQYHTPKAKSTSFRQEFSQNPSQLTHNYQSQIKPNSVNYDKNFDFQLGYHSQNKNNQSSPNKKSKKKLQICTHMINSSKQKPTKDSPNKSNITQNNNQQLPETLNSKKSSKNNYQAQQTNTVDRKDYIINELQQKLQQKERQIKKMSIYMNEYQKLGVKNKKLQKDMKQILTKLIQMKSKQQQSLQISRQSQNHNQFQQICNYQSSSQTQRSFSSQQNQDQSQSQIQIQNTHQQKLYKKSLTDDYIKIYDDLQSSQLLNIEEQEQSYKPNLMKYSQVKKQKNTPSPYSHRKMLSVGARLKESLNAKNQDFKASFDDSILLSSSSSQKLSQKLISPKQNRNKKYDFSKKQHLKTQQTQEGSISLKDIQTYREYYSLSSIENNNQEQILERQSNTKIKIIDQLYENTQKKLEEQTTVKKPKVKYAIKKKTQGQIFSQRNIDALIETNKKLTSIIQNLMKSHDSMFQEVKRMSQKNQMYLNKMTQIQEEFNQIKLNFSQLTLSSQQILNSVKNNFGAESSFKNVLMAIQQKVTKLYESINQNARQMKKQKSKKQGWLQNNHITITTPYLSKINSFGKQSQNQKQEKKMRKQSGSEFKQPASPSFTYLQQSASFLTDSFKLSHSDRSNPSNSRFNYCSTVDDQINVKSTKQSQKNLPKYEEESKIMIIQQSLQGSSESNLISNGTSQFIQIDSGRGVSEKSGTSKDKMRSENSEIRINFDDLDEDASNYKTNFEIIERKDYKKSNHGTRLNQESVELMKSSFGPIIQKQMSRSEKGDSVAGQIQDQVHDVDFANDSPQKQYNRPRQNSSINIFFSSDSICKTNKVVSNIPHDLPHYKTTQNNSSQQSSFKSAKCSQCFTKDQEIKGLKTEAIQMRTIISELNQEKDKLQKLIKSKIQIIDDLQVSLRQLQSLSNLENKKSKKQLNLIQNDLIKSQRQQKFDQTNSFNNDKNNNIPWYKTSNKFQYVSQSKNLDKSTILNLKPIKFDQIQDLLPISKYLSRQIPYDKIQNLKSIEIQIKNQILKQQQIERQLHEKFMKQRGNTLDWAKGSFSKVDEFRQESFLKTKAILIKLIGLIRQFVSQGSQNIKR